MSSDGKKIFLFYSLGAVAKVAHKLAESSDSLVFVPTAKKLTIGKEKIEKCKNFRLAKLGQHNLLVYEKGGKIFAAISDNLNNWKTTNQLTGLKSTGVVVSDFFL